MPCLAWYTTDANHNCFIVTVLCFGKACSFKECLLYSFHIVVAHRVTMYSFFTLASSGSVSARSLQRSTRGDLHRLCSHVYFVPFDLNVQFDMLCFSFQLLKIGYKQSLHLVHFLQLGSHISW